MASVILCFIEKQVGPWNIQVHSRHGSKAHDRKHVHITRPGLGGEYSWNDDGTRHDKSRFPTSGAMIKRAKKLAAEELGISASALQFVSAESGVYVRVAICNDRGIRSIFDSYVRVSELCMIFSTESRVVVVISDEA